MRAYLAALVAALMLLTSRASQATSCGPAGFEDSKEGARFVFSGTATAMGNTGQSPRAEFQVDRVFKGDVAKHVYIESLGMRSASFESGKRYLVFANLTKKGELSASLCGGTRMAPTDWIKRLGPGRAPSTSDGGAGSVRPATWPAKSSSDAATRKGCGACSALSSKPRPYEWLWFCGAVFLAGARRLGRPA